MSLWIVFDSWKETISFLEVSLRFLRIFLGYLVIFWGEGVESKRLLSNVSGVILDFVKALTVSYGLVSGFGTGIK